MTKSPAERLERADRQGADLLRVELETARRKVGSRDLAVIEALNERDRKAAEQPIQDRVKAWLERHPEAAEQLVAMQPITDWAAAERMLDREEYKRLETHRLQAEDRFKAWMANHPEAARQLATNLPLEDGFRAWRKRHPEAAKQLDEIQHSRVEKARTLVERLHAEVEAEREQVLVAELAKREVEARKYNVALDAILMIKRSGPLEATERQRLLIALRDLALFVSKMAEGDRKLATLKKARAEYVATADAARRILNHPSDIAPIAIYGIEVERMMRQLGDAVRQEIATIDAMVESGNALNTVWEPHRDPGQRGVDAELACAIVVHEVYLTVNAGAKLPCTNKTAHAACLQFWQTCTGLTKPKTVWLSRLRLALIASKSEQKSVQAFRDRVRSRLSDG